MRPGVRLGVDVGSVRVGVAVSDPSGMLATPIVVLRRDVRSGTDLDELAATVHEREAVEVVVGLPRGLSGRDGPAAESARDYARSLAGRIPEVPVRLVDERLSTVEAARALRAAGHDSRSARSLVDAAAAVVILQSALDTERSLGVPPGEPLS